LARKVTSEQFRSQAQLLVIRWQLLDGQELDAEARAVAGAGGLLLVNDFQKAERLLREGRSAEARKLFETVAVAHDISALLRESALSRAAYCCYELKHWQACCDHIDNLLQKFPQCSHAGRLLLIKTLAFSRLGKTNLAEQTLSRAASAEQQPDRRRSWLIQAAQQFESDKNLALAAKTYETVVFEYDSQYERPAADVLYAIERAIGVRDQQNQPEASLKLVQHALQLPRKRIDPNQRNRLVLGLASRLQTLGRHDEALAQYRTLVSDGELGPLALLKIGALLDAMQRTEEAAETYYYLLTRYFDANAAQEARERLQQYIAKFKRSHLK
jgi:hypothetical protein